MTNVYISLDRLLPPADEELERVLGEMEIEDVERKHPIIGKYSQILTNLKSQIFQISNYIPKII